MQLLALCTVGSFGCAVWRDVQLAEETSYGVQTVLAHATTLEDDDNDDGDEDDVDDGQCDQGVVEVGLHLWPVEGDCDS